MQTRPLRFALLAILLLPACANMELTRSAFLDDREGVERNPDLEVAWIPDGVEWRCDEEADWPSYSACLIEPVVYVRGEGTRHPEPEEEDLQYLNRKFRDQLVRELTPVLPEVQEAGPGVIRIRAAITDVDPEWVWLNVLGTILVVPPDMGGISCELEFLDADTGELLISMTAYREGTVFLFLETFHRWGHAKHGMKKWAKLLRKELEARIPVDEEAEPESQQVGV